MFIGVINIFDKSLQTLSTIDIFYIVLLCNCTVFFFNDTIEAFWIFFDHSNMRQK